MNTSENPCLCAVIRKAGRIITKRYENYLKPSGLKITQYSMLANIGRNPGITVSELANLLQMDQTTVTRNLRVLEKSAYIYIEFEAADHRVKKIQVSDIGKSKMKEARPLWERVQLEMELSIGKERIEDLITGLGKIAE